MNSLSLAEASQNLDDIINQITENNQPVMIKGSQNDAIVVAKEYWSAMQKTIYLNPILGYIDSIDESINSPREEWVNAQDLGL